MQKITEEEIDATITRIGKLTEEEFIKSYTNELQQQQNLFEFLMDSAQHFEMQEDSVNSMMELCYDILTIYKDKYKKAATVQSDTIMAILQERQEIEEKRAAILGVDLADADAQEKLDHIYAQLKEAMAKDAKAAEKGVYKELFEFEKNQKEGPAYVLNFCAYFIENDKLSANEDKASISSLIEVVVMALEKETNGNK